MFRLEGVTLGSPSHLRPPSQDFMLIAHNQALLMLRSVIMVDMMDNVVKMVGLGWFLEPKSKSNSSGLHPSQDSMLIAHNQALLILRLLKIMDMVDKVDKIAVGRVGLGWVGF